MTEYVFVKCPNFIRRDAQGAIVEIACKVCGQIIAGTTEQVESRTENGGQFVEVRKIKFARFHNYAEAKIEFGCGSAHVTNGCRECLNNDLQDYELQEMYQADVEMEPQGYTPRLKKRKAKRVCALARHAGGLI